MSEDLWNLAMTLFILGLALLVPYGLVRGASKIEEMWRAWRQRRTRLQWSRKWESVRRAFPC